MRKLRVIVVSVVMLGTALTVTASLGQAEDGHTASGQSCWTRSFTDANGVFHSRSLACTPDAVTPAPTAQAQSIPTFPAPSIPTVQAPVIPTAQPPAVSTALPPSISPVPPSSISVDQPPAGSEAAEIWVTMFYSPYSGKVEFTANGQGVPEPLRGTFNSVILLLVDSVGNEVTRRSPGVNTYGAFTFSLAIGLPMGDYALALIDATNGQVLASTTFSAPPDDSQVSTREAPAPGSSSGYLPPWQTCTGLGSACPALNPFGL
jgi:hypothetical protein